jgi:hypothetical protein
MNLFAAGFVTLDHFRFKLKQGLLGQVLGL